MSSSTEAACGEVTPGVAVCCGGVFGDGFWFCAVGGAHASIVNRNEAKSSVAPVLDACLRLERSRESLPEPGRFFPTPLVSIDALPVFLRKRACKMIVPLASLAFVCCVCGRRGPSFRGAARPATA